MVSSEVKEKIVFPLDVSSEEEAISWVKRLKDWVGVFKVGLELFTSCGPSILFKIRELSDSKIFLDLKLNDIPNTILRTVRVISNYQVDWLTVHTLAGREALKAAVNTAYGGLKVLGVTILTSLGRADLMELGFNGDLIREVRELVFHLAGIVASCGCDGIVCSPKEVAKIKELFPELITVVPGIRLKEGKDDQIRVATPYEAVLAGADYLVIGRPIREAFSPVEVCKEVHSQVESALKEKAEKG